MENGSENATVEIPPQVYIISLFSFLSLLGCVAILLTYSLFKELRSLPGKILMNLASAILVASLFTLSSLFVVDNVAVCRAVAVILHYTYTAEFIWMSVFSFEIARALRQANTVLISVSARMEKLGFLTYLVIGWGLPLIVVACTVAVNFTQPDFVRYGGPEKCEDGRSSCPNKYCFITEARGYIFAVFVPVGASLLFNFAAASFSGYVITRATVNRYKLHMQQTISFIRILVPVLAITGVAYVLSAIFIAISITYGYNWALYMFTALGTAQGFIVSVVFILKRRILNLYKGCFSSILLSFRRNSEQRSQVSQETNVCVKNGAHNNHLTAMTVP